MLRKSLKAIACFAVSLAIIICCLPGAFAAESSTKVSVGYYDGGFVYYSDDFTVSQGLAASYGYTVDSSVSCITVLDALVALHVQMLSDSFDPETCKEYLTVSSTGFITKVFGESASTFSFAVNGVSPNDGIFVEAYNGYTGLTCDKATVKSGDKIMFMNFKDGYWSDYYTEFDKAVYNSKENENITITVTGYSIGWYGCSKQEYIDSVTENMNHVDLLLTSDFINYKNIGQTDEKGQITFSVAEEGSYYLITGGTHSGDYGETPVIGNTASLIVINNSEPSDEDDPTDREPDSIGCSHRFVIPFSVKMYLNENGEKKDILISISFKCIKCKEKISKDFCFEIPEFIEILIGMIPAPIK